MRLLHTLLWAVVALACAAPTCDKHDSALGSGSGSSAWERMPSPSAAATTSPTSETDAGATQHQDVVHAMETVTGAPLEHAASTTKSTKPAKKRPTDRGGGDYESGGRSTSSASPAPPPPPKKPELPERGRRLGEPCDSDYQCASDMCWFQQCKQKSGTKLPNGEKCDSNTQCASNYCFGTCQ